MAKRLKRSMKAALDFLDEAHARGVVIVFRDLDLPGYPGPQLLYSHNSRLHRNVCRAVLRKAEPLRADLIAAFSHKAVFVQQEARAEARDRDIPYEQAVAMVESNPSVIARDWRSSFSVDQLRGDKLCIFSRRSEIH